VRRIRTFRQIDALAKASPSAGWGNCAGASPCWLVRTEGKLARAQVGCLAKLCMGGIQKRPRPWKSPRSLPRGPAPAIAPDQARCVTTDLVTAGNLRLRQLPNRGSARNESPCRRGRSRQRKAPPGALDKVRQGSKLGTETGRLMYRRQIALLA